MIVFMIKWPTFQVLPILLFVTFRNIYSLVTRPFVHCFDNVVMILTDISYMVVLILYVVLLYLRNYLSEEFIYYVIGNLIILNIGFLIIFNIYVMIQATIMGLYQLAFGKKKVPKLQKPNQVLPDCENSMLSPQRLKGKNIVN